jgi:uncharacterized protein YjbJ (UPF0337 family)
MKFRFHTTPASRKQGNLAIDIARVAPAPHLLFLVTWHEGHATRFRRKKMTGKSDEIKGRVKEAAGAITDDDRLRREGKIDQAAGKVKQAAEKAVEKVQGAVKDANKR